MRNVKITMKYLRSLVSLPKKTYKHDDNSEYDMSYITDRIIVASGPVNSTVQKLYRYPVEKLVEILNHNHGANWHIWNLRGEGKGYNDEEVDYKISYYPFPDHQAPPFALLLEVVYKMDQFLNLNPSNVALVHCKAGKGRSGTLCCATVMLQQYTHLNHTSFSEVNVLYTQKRMHPNGGGGITIKSQRRYLNYWQQYLYFQEHQQQQCKAFHSPETPTTTTFTQIRIHDVASYLIRDKLFLQVKLQCYTKDCRKGSKIQEIWAYDGSTDTVTMEGGDAVITVPYLPQNSVDYRLEVNGYLFAWFSVYFEPQHTSFKMAQFDGFKGTRHQGSRIFSSVSVSWDLAGPIQPIKPL